jgi:predicted nucleic acid-binding protein/GNAT superfamily N-acetyltransferase
MLLVNCTWSEVRSYVDTTRINADREKNALGFLPPVAYEQAARQGNLYVATENGVYVGHLLFGGTFPRARIFQLYVKEAYRQKGVATLLLRKLQIELEKSGFLTISASVANDLVANAFWEKSGFPVLRQKEGGSSRRRTINVRVKDLDTPHLFSPDLVSKPSDLGIAARYVVPIPVYVLDLNVFWDVILNRPRVDYARQVIGAALDNFIRVVVTTEFLNELKRTTREGESDPALEFALQLPALPMPPSEMILEITAELAPLVFPTKAAGLLSAQDRSDLLHLATAIHHRVNGFLTSDDAIVRCSDTLLTKFGLEIFHIQHFADTLGKRKKEIISLQARVSGETLKLWELVTNDSSFLGSFLELVGADESQYREVLGDGLSNNHIKRVAVTSEEDMVCLAYWDTRGTLQGRCTVKILANEDHPACETALDCLLSRIAAEVSKTSPLVVELDLALGSALARKTGLLHGFKHVTDSVPSQLSKVCVGRPINNDNLTKIVNTIKRLSGLSIPATLPAFSSLYQEMVLKDAFDVQRNVELGQLERMLSPVLFLLPSRTGVIVPIQRVYAEQLFGTSAQMTFIPGKEAVLFSERIYLSSSRNLHTLIEGAILLFYESGRNGGRSALIAIARSLGTLVIGKQQVPPSILRRGVIENDELNELSANEKIAVTRFDNVMLLPRIIPLFDLRTTGCVDGSNLVTARRITDKQMDAIIREAYKQ